MHQIDKGVYSTASVIRREFGDLIADCYIKSARDNGVVLVPQWKGKEVIHYWTGVMRMPKNLVSYLQD